MNSPNFLSPFYIGITSVLKIFFLYILTKWYGLLFSISFFYMFFRVYQLIIYKINNLIPLSFSDLINLGKYIFKKDIFKEIKFEKPKGKEEIIDSIKNFLSNTSVFQKKIVYKRNNFYWIKINDLEQLYNQICFNNGEEIKKIKERKINIFKSIPYKIIISENKNELKLYLQLTPLIDEKYFKLLLKFINETKNNIEVDENKRLPKIIVLLYNIILYQIQFLVEIIIVLLLTIKNN